MLKALPILTLLLILLLSLPLILFTFSVWQATGQITSAALFPVTALLLCSCYLILVYRYNIWSQGKQLQRIVLLHWLLALVLLLLLVYPWNWISDLFRTWYSGSMYSQFVFVDMSLWTSTYGSHIFIVFIVLQVMQGTLLYRQIRRSVVSSDEEDNL